MTRRRRGVLSVPLRRVREGHPVPCYARDGDAGMDLFAAQDVRIDPAGGRALVATGVAVAIPAGYAALILSRSGLALRHGVTVLNAPGLIDSGYRGELKVLLLNSDPLAAYHVSVGARVAQMLIVPVAVASLVVVAELPPTARGSGGFGSTGGLGVPARVNS